MNTSDKRPDGRRTPGKQEMLALAKKHGLDFGEGSKCRISAQQLRALTTILAKADFYELHKEAYTKAKELVAQQAAMLRKIQAEWQAWRKAQMVGGLVGGASDAEDDALTELICTMTRLSAQLYKIDQVKRGAGG